MILSQKSLTSVTAAVAAKPILQLKLDLKMSKVLTTKIFIIVYVIDNPIINSHPN